VKKSKKKKRKKSSYSKGEEEVSCCDERCDELSLVLASNNSPGELSGPEVRIFFRKISRRALVNPD